MTAFIPPPARPPLLLRLGIWMAQRAAGRDLLLARLLAWYPKAALSSAVLEALIAHGPPDLEARTLKLVRMTVSFTAACPFCIGMNGAEPERFAITGEEIAAMQGRLAPEAVASFTERERVAVSYAQAVSRTPLSFPPELVARLRAGFTEREIVVLATTAAQVNYWTRLIQALGVPE